MEQRIIIISPFYNAEKYIENCILSVASQDYGNYLHILIDDSSSDETLSVVYSTIDKLPREIQKNFVVISRDVNIGAVANQIKTLRDFNLKDDDIIMLLDGDDWLVNDPNIFNNYNEIYDNTTEFTYGSSWSLADNIPLISQPYPPEIKTTKSYRKYRFNWNMPYTHLRTFRKYLINKISDDIFKDNNGEWYRAGGDNAVFYNIIEQADPDKVKVVSDIVYNYNDLNPLNDYKINPEEQNKNANCIIASKSKYSIVIPTLWRYERFTDFLKKLVGSEYVDDIIIIDNDPTNTPNDDILNHEKIILQDFDKNIYVNPAWNYGVSISINDKICLLNDDVEFDLELFKKVDPFYTQDFGVIGLCPGESYFNQPPVIDGNIEILPWNGEHTYGFGCLMFIKKEDWKPIPECLKIYYGDNFIFDYSLSKGKQNYIITDIKFNKVFARTTSDTTITQGALEKENVMYDIIKRNNFEDKGIEVFYYLYIPNDSHIMYSFWWIDEQLGLIKSSELYKNSNINLVLTIPRYISNFNGFYFDKNGNFSETYCNFLFEDKIREYINIKYPFANILSIRDTGEENIYEGHCLSYIFDYAVIYPEKSFLYIHSKGISGFTPNQKSWLEVLNYYLIDNWRECVEKLKGNDIVGIKDSSPIDILSGNFWWATGKYISTLQPPSNIDNSSRYNYEHWITSNNNKKCYLNDINNDFYKQYYFLKNEHYNLTNVNDFREKKILIAIPTAKYIEPDTFKSIYNLIVPDGYKVTYQHFHGYQIDQIRNLISDWTIKGYDYLFSVDSDIVFEPDTLIKLLSHDKDVVTGMYIQRIPGTHNLELYDKTGRISYETIAGKGLVEISGCGFGCVLIKKQVFVDIGYPQFEYHSAIDHKDTISEDTDFCNKATNKGFRVWVDTSIKCSHIGSSSFDIKET